MGLSDAGNQFHYFRLTADDRILWGGYDAVHYFGSRVEPALDRRPVEVLPDILFAGPDELHGASQFRR